VLLTAVGGEGQRPIITLHLFDIYIGYIVYYIGSMALLWFDTFGIQLLLNVFQLML